MPGNNYKIQKCDKESDMLSKSELAKDGNSRECEPILGNVSGLAAAAVLHF